MIENNYLRVSCTLKRGNADACFRSVLYGQAVLQRSYDARSRGYRHNAQNRIYVPSFKM